MNDSDNTQDRGLTTEQIAAAGRQTRQQDVPAQVGDQGFDDNYVDDDGARLTAVDDDDYVDDDGARLTAVDDDDDYVDDDGARLTAVDAASGRADRSDPYGSVAAEPEPRASLLEDDELQSMTMRWKDIQAEFVDEPREAVQEADALVAELMQRLAAMFAGERAGLEERWAGGNQVSTEDLRQGLRRYRSFFERLLAA
jgi:hypothetical protein